MAYHREINSLAESRLYQIVVFLKAQLSLVYAADLAYLGHAGCRCELNGMVGILSNVGHGFFYNGLHLSATMYVGNLVVFLPRPMMRLLFIQYHLSGLSGSPCFCLKYRPGMLEAERTQRSPINIPYSCGQRCHESVLLAFV